MSQGGEYLSPEIINNGIQDLGPNAGYPNFSVRVRRGLPDFLNSVNLKYVKLGYGYLLNHGLYLAIAPIILVFFCSHLGRLNWGDLLQCDPLNAISIFGFLYFVVYVYHELTPRSVYLIDFICYTPPDELKISNQEYINLARKSGKYGDAAIEFQQRVLKNSGLGNETYLPRVVFRPDYKMNLRDGREEARMLMFGAIDEVLATTRVRPKDIKVLIVNCGVLNPTPSLSAMVINHYKLRHNIQSFNLGGMGCAAGVVAIDLAKDILGAHKGSYALVVSFEAITYTWYSGNDVDMLIPNCFFRMGSAAMLLSNRRIDSWFAKYELKQLVHTHKGTDNRIFNSIRLKEDVHGNQGISVSKDVIEVGGHALKANITTLGPLVLPVSEQFHFFKSLLFKNKSKTPYIPDYKLAFEHICIAATSKKILDEIQKNLDLTDDYMDASRTTLERFGNTSSSSIWYELAYLEAKTKMKKGDRVCQIAFGSGFQCNSVVWLSLRSSKKENKKPWGSH